jgi:peptidoglycan/LPS O-acetylase OafA/YrhL
MLSLAEGMENRFTIPVTERTAFSHEASSRQAHLDGLRGCSAIMVLLNHLVMMVWPGTVLTEIHPPGTPIWQLAVAASPASILWDGRLAVSVFFILSGYVLTAAVLPQPMTLPALVVKRYIRLALPVLVATLPTLLLLPAGFYLNHDLAYVTGSTWFETVTMTGFHPGFLNWLRTALWTVFFVDGHTSYNALLWTMQYEFYGSLLTFLLVTLVAGLRWRLGAAMALCVILGEVPGYALLQLFCVGIFLHDVAYLARREKLPIRLTPWLADILGLCLFVVGLCLPRLVAVSIDERGWAFDDLIWLRHLMPSWQGDRWMIAAVFVLGGLQLSHRLRRVLSASWARFLGRISFPLYLFHLPVLLSFGCWLLLILLPYWGQTCAALVTFGVTAVAALLIAWLAVFLVERPSLYLSARIGAVLDRYCLSLARAVLRPALRHRS